jgi:glycosyltransferase involved in cell wall biosynthesis
VELAGFASARAHSRPACEPSDPIVSIVLPTYNRAALLVEAIASVRAQTYRTWQLHIVDDGSTDETPTRVPLDDDRVRLIQCSHRGNVAAVRNTGLAACTGRYVAFLDSDDRWHPEKLERQVRRLEASPDAGWCHGPFTLIDGVGRRVPMRAGPSWRPREGELVEAVLTTAASIALQSVLARTELAQRIRFDERIPVVDDYDFLLQLALLAPAVAVGDVVLAEIREHPHRMTNQRWNHGLGFAIAYRKAYRQVGDRHLRYVCMRQGVRLLRHFLANARARSQFWCGVRQAIHALRTA